MCLLMYMYATNVLGECRTLWGEHEQAACILATEERMRYQKLLGDDSCREFVVVVASSQYMVPI